MDKLLRFQLICGKIENISGPVQSLVWKSFKVGSEWTETNQIFQGLTKHLKPYGVTITKEWKCQNTPVFAIISIAPLSCLSPGFQMEYVIQHFQRALAFSRQTQMFLRYPYFCYDYVRSPNDYIISKVFYCLMQRLATGVLSMWSLIRSESTEQLSWTKIKPGPTHSLTFQRKL